MATAGVALVTLGLWVLRDSLENTHRGLLFLLVVAAAAATGGTRCGVLASVLGFLSWNFFFFPPVLTFSVHGASNWLTLGVFLVIGVLVGQMTGRIRLREIEARTREEETTALCSTLQTLNLYSDAGRALPFILAQIAEMVPTRALAVVMRDEEGVESHHAVHGDARCVPEGTSTPLAAGSLAVPLTLHPNTTGLLVAVPAEGKPFDVPGRRLLHALAAQISVFLERSRLQRETALLQQRQEAERLRLVLFSSLSHNLKTPLASLNATLGGLMAADVPWDAELLRESFELMAEDVKRLTLHISNLLDLARLESGTWQPQRELFEVAELLDVALRLFSQADRQRIQVTLPPHNPCLSVDSVQVAQVIRHLVENALAYSPAGTPVCLEAFVEEDHLCVQVDDQGPGVPHEERELIFEKFYRGQAAKARSVRGTGLGLSICREILSAHTGNLAVSSSPSGGARFTARLPLAT